MAIKDAYQTLKRRFKRVFSLIEDYDDTPPKEGSGDVAKYVSGLWEDGVKFFETSFAANKDATRFGYSSPEEFYKALSKLENGQHYEVFPSRIAGVGNDWKQELVDNEIQKQSRAKRNHITANWHDVVISPNIVGINEIFDQERKATGWSEKVREWVAYAQNFGDVWVRSILDKSENPIGVATEITCDLGMVVRTPETKSLSRLDGCWYAVHGQRVNGQWVKKNYPDFDITKSDSGSIPKFLQIDKGFQSTQYGHTKMFNKLEVFIDDESLEEIPFDPAEFEQRIGALMANVQADEQNQVLPKKEDNHKKYIKAYLDWLEEKTDFYKQIADETLAQGGDISPDDLKLMDKVIQTVSDQVYLHEAESAKQVTDIPDGKRKKYPLGRYVVTIDGVIAEDKQNPYRIPWRKMFHYLASEKVPNRYDGRGDVEILLQDNKILDTMISRFADDALLSTYKKPWFKVTEKKQIEEAGYSTDPTKPGYYVDQSPIFTGGVPNNQYLDIYRTVKQGIKESLSINQVTRGESSFRGESGRHAEALLNQNVVMVAGELNQNLNDFLEGVIECRLMFWKEFYTEARPYTIDGQQVMLVLADHLRQMEVEENGQKVYKDIGAIEVSVRPDSNFPNKDDSEINELVKLSSLKNEDGLPLIPSGMILDRIAKKHPSLGSSGKYRRESQLIALGKQALQQQQMAQQQMQQQGQSLEAVKRKVQNRVTTEAANQIMGGNGNG